MITELVVLYAVGAAIFQTLSIWEERRRFASLWKCHQELTSGLADFVNKNQQVPPGREAQPKETTQDAKH